MVRAWLDTDVLRSIPGLKLLPRLLSCLLAVHCMVSLLLVPLLLLRVITRMVLLFGARLAFLLLARPFRRRVFKGVVTVRGMVPLLFAHILLYCAHMVCFTAVAWFCLLSVQDFAGFRY